jgi:YHS domain-containing protein
MKHLISASLLVLISACANYRTTSNTPSSNSEPVPVPVPMITENAAPAAYEGNCAMGMCLKKKVKGDERYSVDYKGKHYVFSSPQARDKFLANIDRNINLANRQWEVRQ